MIDRSDLFRRIRKALANLYPDWSSARRLAYDAGLDIGQIERAERPIDFWHSILLEAEREGKVDALLLLAMQEYPSRTELSTLREESWRAGPLAPETPLRHAGPGYPRKSAISWSVFARHTQEGIEETTHGSELAAIAHAPALRKAERYQIAVCRRTIALVLLGVGSVVLGIGGGRNNDALLLTVVVSVAVTIGFIAPWFYLIGYPEEQWLTKYVDGLSAEGALMTFHDAVSSHPGLQQRTKAALNEMISKRALELAEPSRGKGNAT